MLSAVQPATHFMGELRNIRNNLAVQHHRLAQRRLRSASITTAHCWETSRTPGNLSQKPKSSYSHVVMSAAATESFFQVSRFVRAVFIAQVLLVHILVWNRAIVLGKRVCLVK